jgi:hypothetical protein
MINDNKYGMIGKPVRVVSRIPTNSDSNVTPFFGLFEMQDGLCTPYEVATKHVYFLDEFRDESLTVEDREARWTSVVKDHLISICESRPPTRSALAKADVFESLKQVWAGDEQLGLPESIDVSKLGGNLLHAYRKLCYQASKAKLKECLVEFEPRFLGVELQYGGPLNKKAIENAQRSLEAYVSTRKAADRGKKNAPGSNVNNSRSLQISAAGSHRVHAGSMSNRSSLASRSATHNYELRHNSRLASDEPNRQGYLGHGPEGSVNVDVKAPLITRDIRGVPGIETELGIRYTHNWNGQAEFQQWDIPVLKTEPQIKAESANATASSTSPRPGLTMPTVTHSTEQGEDLTGCNSYNERDYEHELPAPPSLRIARNDSAFDANALLDRPPKRRRLHETIAQFPEYQPVDYEPTEATTMTTDLIATEKEDLARLHALLNDMATPEMLKEMIERFENSVGNEQECAKVAFNHAFLQVTTQIVTASKARIKALEGMK